MSSRKEKRESEICSAITDLLRKADSQVVNIKQMWRENYDMFVHGTRSPEKMEWQTNFSVNKLQTSIRAAQGRLVNILVNNPDWYELCSRSDYNEEAALLAPAFQKILNYYLEAAHFKRHAGTFFLCSLISQGNLYIGWKSRLIQNPEYVIKKTEAERRKEQQRIAKNVANPQVEATEDLSADGLEAKLLEAVEGFVNEAQGLEESQTKIEPYIQIGTLDLMDPNHERVYWDPNVAYMEDSIWKAFEYDVNKYELNYFAKLGYFSRSKVDKIAPNSNAGDMPRMVLQRTRYSNLSRNPADGEELIKLTVYSGPLIINNEIVKDNYYAIIANDSVLLRSGEYPFWEPPGHKTPIINAAVRQIPYRPTGAGIGDNAVPLQKIYDSNWQLVCDTFRFGISGINVVNYNNLVDKGQLYQGIHPGMTVHVRGAPKDSFERISLTSNIENQAHPVQSMLEGAIDSLTGINDLMVGGGNRYSRTPAAETNARLNAGSENVNIIALDLEQNFLIPALEKAFARVLQFGLSEINNNPELRNLLTEEELYEVGKLQAGSRLDILNHWYKFKIKGFSSAQDQSEQAMRDNELLQIINSGGPLAQLINLPEFMKQYFRNRGIKDTRALLIQNSPLSIVATENEVLMSNRDVAVLPNDDHNFHLQQQGALAQSPYATDALRNHVMMHQQMLQQIQLAQKQQGENPEEQVQ